MPRYIWAVAPSTILLEKASAASAVSASDTGKVSQEEDC